MWWILLTVALVLTIAVALFLHRPPFGALPTGDSLRRVEASPQYRDGAFANQHHTPDLSEDASYWAVLKEFLWDKKVRQVPAKPLPTQKQALSVSPDEPSVVWFGHSSYLLYVEGKTILVDPVFSGAASPLAFTTPAFAGTDVYRVDELPAQIDLLIISHDHWDHLDYATVTALQPRVRQVVTGLGTAAHLAAWGYTPAQLKELDWQASVQPDSGWTVTAMPARHFSGRGLRRNRSLWCAFVLQSPRYRLYLGGDSGYDDHFAAAGQQFGGFDLAILECGQYDKSWKYIHMMPEEVIQAGEDLQARRVMPVHWAKFVLGNHAWDEPVRRVWAEGRRRQTDLLIPRIGQIVPFLAHQTETWWEGLE